MKSHVVLLIPLLVLTASCKPADTRYKSSLIDDLSGVWVYPHECSTGENDEKSLLVVDRNSYTYYDYSNQHGYEQSRSGDIMGQEGVYFFPNEASFYSPKFLVERNGQRFLVLNKLDYEQYVKNDRLDLPVLIRACDKLDLNQPPPQLSIEILELPYDNPFLE